MRYVSILLFLVVSVCANAYHKDSLFTSEQAKDVYVDLKRDISVRHTPVPVWVKDVKQPVVSLCGEWLFASLGKEQRDGIQHPGKEWSPTSVPSEWYMESFKVEPGGWAGYYKEFELPSDWSTQEVLIRFGAVESECELYLNGRLVGTHQGSMKQFEMNLTSFLVPGVNKLMLYVRSESLASDISKISHYAKHQVGGILRNVELIALPQKHINNLYCRASLSENLDEGYVNIQTSLSKSMKNTRIQVTIKERGIEGLSLSSKEVFNQVFPIKDMDTILIKNPVLWHAETPFLYTVEVSLLDKGVKTEVLKKNIGFRKIEKRGNVLYVNNAPVKLRGVARHDIRAYDGRALKDTALLHDDIKQLRDANCNFIRTSHYTPDSYMLDLCDRYGIFVEDEAPVCWESAPDTYDRMRQIFYSFTSMLLRDREHPCILIWSLGNESVWSPKFYPCLLFAKEETPQIPVKFSHSETHGIIKATDIGTKHYPGWKGLMAFENYFRPITFGEALHLNCYNTSENITDPGLRDMWGDYLKYFVDFMQESPSIAGLGIWGCNDEMFYPEGNQPCGYGPWGVVDGFRREKPEFWHMKMGYSPLVVLSKNFSISGGNTFVALENRYNIQNANQVDIVWKDGNQEGIVSADIVPGDQGALCIPHIMRGDTLELIMKDRRGFEISRWNVPRYYRAYYLMPELRKGNVKVMSTDSTYVICSKDIQYVFNRNSGVLSSIRKRGEEIISGGLNMYAIPHLKENEVIDYIPQESTGEAHFASAPLSDWTFLSETLQDKEDGIVIIVRGKYGDNPVELEYHFDGMNRMRMNYVLNLAKLGNKIRQIGVGFTLPKSYNTLWWKRKGLWSVYPENHIGRTEGTAKTFYPETQSNYLLDRTIPKHGFNKDGNEYGSNDFRSTKQHLIKGRFISEAGDTLTIESNGKQHLRAWVLPEGITFLVANYSDSGNEFYLNYDANRTKYLDAYLAEDGDFAGWLQIKF